MTTAEAAADPTAAPPVPLRANRDFRLLWLGQALSGFGSSMSFVALPLVLLSGGYSTSAASVIGTAILLTGMVARLPAGYLTDRFNHRALMLTADVARCAVLGVVALLTFLGELPLVLAVAAVVVARLGAELFMPSQSAVIRRVVPREQLPTAFSLNQARTYAVEIAAPATAGLLVAVSLGLPFAVDALTFAASAVCVLLLSPHARASRASTASTGGVGGGRGGAAGSSPEAKAKAGAAAEAPAGRAPERTREFFRGLTAGLRHVASERFLRTLALFSTGLNFLFQALVYALILGFGQRDGGSGAVGATMSAAAITGLVGSFLAPFLQRRLRLQVLVAIGPTLACALLAVAWRSGSDVAFAASFAAICLMTPVIGAALGVILATLVPREIFGRTSTSISFVTEILQPLGPLAAGLLLAALPMSSVALLFACCFAVLAVLALFLPNPPKPAAP